MKQNEEKVDLDIVELNNQDKNIIMASNPMIVNSSFFDSLKQYYYLKSGRIFAPDFELIDSTFTSSFTRLFLKRCVEISVENPGLRILKPECNLSDCDIEKIQTFLYLYNAALKKECYLNVTIHGLPAYTCPIYYIELYDDPE